MVAAVETRVAPSWPGANNHTEAAVCSARYRQAVSNALRGGLEKPERGRDRGETGERPGPRDPEVAGVTPSARRKRSPRESEAQGTSPERQGRGGPGTGGHGALRHARATRHPGQKERLRHPGWRSTGTAGQSREQSHLV